MDKALNHYILMGQPAVLLKSFLTAMRTVSSESHTFYKSTTNLFSLCNALYILIYR